MHQRQICERKLCGVREQRVTGGTGLLPKVMLEQRHERRENLQGTEGT